MVGIIFVPGAHFECVHASCCGNHGIFQQMIRFALHAACFREWARLVAGTNDTLVTTSANSGFLSGDRIQLNGVKPQRNEADLSREWSSGNFERELDL